MLVEPLILTVTSSKPSNQSRTDKLRPRFSSVGGDGAIGNAAAYRPFDGDQIALVLFTS